MLTGGVYDVETELTLQLANNLEVTRDNAVIILDGANSVIESFDTQTALQVSVDLTLTSIAANGVLEIMSGRDFTSGNAISNFGRLILGGGAFTSGRLYDAAGSTLQGYGAVTSIFIDHGGIVSTGVLSFSGHGDNFSGAMSGVQIAFSGGRSTLLSGATLTCASWSMAGGASVAVRENLSHASLPSPRPRLPSLSFPGTPCR